MCHSEESPAPPLWKQLARQVRRAGYRAATFIEQTFMHPGALVPPAHLRVYYYRTVRHDGFRRASESARTEMLTRGLQPDHRLLDIGSGIGNLPLGLADYPRSDYDGLEIHPEAVQWCQQTITPRFPRFRFHQADVSSRAYNPNGTISAASYRFPFPDGRFDFVFLASVFTHMLPHEVDNYVREIARVLAPGGTCVASYFLLNDNTRAGVEAKRSFMTFDVPHKSALCRLHSATVPEAAVALEEAFVQRLHQDAGLGIRDIRRGAWWSGQAHDQDVLTAVGK